MISWRIQIEQTEGAAGVKATALSECRKNQTTLGKHIRGVAGFYSVFFFGFLFFCAN